MRKTALITGITGQDGAYLAHFLLQKGYEVHGLRRYEASDDTGRLRELLGDLSACHALRLHYGDMTDGGGLTALLAQIRPHEIYNLAGLSHVQVSYTIPEYTADADALGALRLLEAVRNLGLRDHTRLYQASTSELFGNSPAPQNENTPFAPCSPYATAKLFAYWSMRNYRDNFGLHASNGILFNHESPLRGEEFVTRKITRTVAAIAAGQSGRLVLGNLNARRDWGHARDYVAGMWAILQQDRPDDYVLATGAARSVRDFVVAAFAHIGVNIIWRGKNMQEIGVDAATQRILVQVDPRLFRPIDVNELIGDPAKAQRVLGWRAQTGFDDLVREMMAHDLQAAGLNLRSGPDIAALSA